MEKTLLSQALGSALKPTDFYQEAVSRVERKLVTEGFNTGNGEDTPQTLVELEEHIAAYGDEISHLSDHSDELDTIRANFDTMTDVEVANRLNRIERSFSDNQVSLLTESFTDSFRKKAVLTLESMDKRIKISLIALIVAATLKLITWLIDFLRNGKKKKKTKTVSERERDYKEELNKRTKARKEEYYDKTYEFYSDTIRTIIGDVLDYSSVGNARSSGENVDGLAHLFMKEILDYVDSLEIEVPLKRKTTENVLRDINTFISGGIAIGWFGFNEKTRKQIARELVDFELRGQKPPISPTLAKLASVVSDSKDVQAMWTTNQRWRNNELRLLTAYSATDILIFASDMANSAGCVRRFFEGYNARQWLRESDGDTATAHTDAFAFNSNAQHASVTRLFLNRLVEVDNPSQVDGVREAAIDLARNASIDVNSSTRVSTPVCYADFIVEDHVSAQGSGKVIKPVDTEFVRAEAYRGLEDYLNSLGRSDGLRTFTELFFTMHGDYHHQDNIEQRLKVMSAEYFSDSYSIIDKLKDVKSDLNDLKVLIEMTHRERGNQRAPEGTEFVFDVKIPQERIGMLKKDKRISNYTDEVSVGDYLRKLITMHQRAVKGWTGYLSAVERMVMTTNQLDI